MSKPRDYRLQLKDHRFWLELTVHESDGCDYPTRCCFLHIGYEWEFSARTARAMGKRLLDIADWMDEKNKQEV